MGEGCTVVLGGEGEGDVLGLGPRVADYTAKSSRFETLLMVPKWCFKPLTVVLAPQLVIRGTNYRVTVRNGVRTAALQSLETPLMDSHHRYI